MTMKNLPFLTIPLILLSACASQSDLVNVQGDLKQIKTQSAGSYSEVSQMREELASLKGIVEELRHANGQALNRLDVEDSLMVRKTEDIEGRIARIEQYLGIAKETKRLSTVIVPAPSVQGGKETSSVTQKQAAATVQNALLSDGMQKMDKGDFNGARGNFSSFIAQNPKSELIDDAQFYIGETYFSEKWYEKAILEYQVVISKYPKSNKRPAALYKQALAFENIGDAVNAKARFKDVINVYPNSPEAKLAKKKVR
jgi:tol-pal system protein YbgF